MRSEIALLRMHPLTAYVALTFAISWGGFLLAVGPDGFSRTDWQTEPRFPLAIAAMLSGPSVAGLLLTTLLDGSAGLRELGSRLLRWRVGLGWYAFALLPAPVLARAVLFSLSVSAPVLVEADKAAVLLSGLAAGLTTVLEEVGWTGFAVPRLRRRHGVLATGLILGVVWAAWHLLQGLFISGTYAGTVPMGTFVLLNTLGSVVQLSAYRVLLVWLHERTSSLLLVTLMHGSLTATTIFILRPLTTGVPFLACGWGLAALFWLVVAAVTIGRARLGRRSRASPAR